MSVDGTKSDVFALNFRKSGRRGTFHAEPAELEGEAGGFSVSTASATDITVFTVPSMKAFHLKTLIVQNNKAAAATLQLFASDGAGKQRVAITLPATDTVVLGAGAQQLQGMLFGFSYSTGGLYARITSASTEVTIFAGGQVRDQDNT
jgi:hypothetical protein